MERSLVFAILAGLFFGVWPLIMRLSGLPWAIAGVILQIGSCLVFIYYLKQQSSWAAWLSFGAAVGIACGILNGFGQINLQKLLAMKEAQLAQAITLMVVTQIVITAVGAKIFFGEQFGWKKILGCTLALVAVKLLIGK